MNDEIVFVKVEFLKEDLEKNIEFITRFKNIMIELSLIFDECSSYYFKDILNKCDIILNVLNRYVEDS